MWQLRLYGEIELLDPAGNPVVVPYRQIIVLLVALIQNRSAGIARPDLAALAWPDSPADKRLNSLRQALSVLRNLIGAENVISSFASCRLSGEFQIKCDLDDVSMRRTGELHAAFRFDWLYLEAEETFDTNEPGRSPTDGFFEFAIFTASSDKERALCLMRENLSACHALSHQQLSALETKVRDCRILPGWRHYFSGCVMRDNGLHAQSLAFLTAALETAQATSDIELTIQAGVQLSLAELWSGNLNKAKHFAIIVDRAASGSRNSNLMASAAQLKGCVLIHLGRHEEANAAYSKSVQLYTNALDSYTILSIHQYYSALLKAKSFEKIDFDENSRMATSSGHKMMSWFSKAGKMLSQRDDMRPDVLVHHASESLSLAEETGNVYYSVLARECLIKALAKAGEKEAAVKMKGETQRLRGQLGLKYCLWDEMAYQPVA